MSDHLSIDAFTQRLINACDNIIEAEPLLSQADRDLGDGDHGLGMKRGMEAAKAKLEEGGFTTVNEIAIAVGKAMMSSMGGASGAIFGSFFRAGGKAMPAEDSLSVEGYIALINGGLAGVQARGKAEPGDKTCVDALHQAAAAVVGKTDLSDALAAAATGAEQGTEKSKAMVAKFGRAKTLGEQAIGFPDPGAMSFTIILKTLAEG